MAARVCHRLYLVLHHAPSLAASVTLVKYQCLPPVRTALLPKATPRSAPRGVCKRRALPPPEALRERLKPDDSRRPASRSRLPALWQGAHCVHPSGAVLDDRHRWRVEVPPDAGAASIHSGDRLGRGMSWRSSARQRLFAAANVLLRKRSQMPFGALPGPPLRRARKPARAKGLAETVGTKPKRSESRNSALKAGGHRFDPGTLHQRTPGKRGFPLSGLQTNAGARKMLAAGPRLAARRPDRGDSPP
jgi:hypothetical protein